MLSVGPEHAEGKQLAVNMPPANQLVIQHNLLLHVRFNTAY